MRLPFKVPAPESWCICHDGDPEQDDQEDHDDDGYVGEEGVEPELRCMVHGVCDECEARRIFCKRNTFFIFAKIVNIILGAQYSAQLPGP